MCPPTVAPDTERLTNTGPTLRLPSVEAVSNLGAFKLVPSDMIFCLAARDPVQVIRQNGEKRPKGCISVLVY